MTIWKRVILTPRIFAALASPERIRVLRALEERNMTGTEVAAKLALSKSTAFKELSRLEEAELVARMEGNRKWVYYRITEIARRILHPEDVVMTFGSEGEGSAPASQLRDLAGALERGPQGSP